MTKDRILEHLARIPFMPAARLKNAHAQTLAGSFVPRRFTRAVLSAEKRYFETSPGARVLAHCSWQARPRDTPTLLLVHGMEGSSDSRYMLGTADKALAAGFSAVRLNMRNCGGTEHLTPTLYHAGLTDDLRHVISELRDRDGVEQLYVAGFSLGGNVVLKLAGEYGSDLPENLRGVVAVSASIDLAAGADAIELRSNFIYSTRFVLSLRSRLRRKARLFPASYDPKLLRGVWTIRKFDDAYVAPHFGFRDSSDYYERASAMRVIDRVNVRTLIVHAQDDPFIPFESFKNPRVASNPNISLLAPRQGGHVGFIAADRQGEDRFWAEAMAIEFVRLLSGVTYLKDTKASG